MTTAPPDAIGDDDVIFPTAKALRALGYHVPDVVADTEPLIVFHEGVVPS